MKGTFDRDVGWAGEQQTRVGGAKGGVLISAGYSCVRTDLLAGYLPSREPASFSGQHLLIGSLLPTSFTFGACPTHKDFGDFGLRHHSNLLARP